MMDVWNVLEVLGIISLCIVVIQILFKALPWIYRNIIGPMILGPKHKLRHFGEWALVTGATDGIGKSYVKQLAQKGLNIILVSRTQYKLESVANEIENAYNVRTKVIAVDFSLGDFGIYDKIAAEIDGLNIGILVNNVGMFYNYPEFFLQIPNRRQFCERMTRLNMTSVMEMCNVVLPQMLVNKKGIIMNISSLSAQIPQPLVTVYSASKAFVDKFSEDLSIEYGPQGIIVQSVLPGQVATKMSKIERESLTAPSADRYVAAALKTIGYTDHTNGYFSHTLFNLVINTMRDYLPTRLTNALVLSQMKKLHNTMKASDEQLQSV